MEVYGQSKVAAGPANVIFLSSFMGREGPNSVHKCDWKCKNEHVCANMYRCKLTGLTHICDKNCNQRILYDNHSSLCRASGKIFPLTSAEEQAVKGVRRKLEAESSPPDSCGFKRRRDAKFHPSPFERSFSAVSPISIPAMAAPKNSFLLVSISFSLLSVSFATFTITNNCPQTIWPGTLAGAGTPPLPTTGFRLDPGLSVRVPSSPGWSGRIWARTGCTFDEAGNGTCQTGDCGGRLECNGLGATPPASLFEVTLGQGNDKDFYDVSIVDGYNLPMIAAPRGVYGACNATGCASDINMGCPKELQVVSLNGMREGVIACRSACEAFGLDQYCCSGEFANPTTCKPSFYSTIFKRACPSAYSYAFDDGTSTFTCKAYDYAIVFCPAAAENVMNATSGAYTDPSYTDPAIQEQPSKSNRKVVNNLVSSSNVYLPRPMPILLLVLGFFFST